MKSKFLSPFFLIGVTIIVIAIVSWFAFPAWHARPNGGLELLGVVFLGVLAAARNFIGIFKDTRDLQKNEEANTAAETIPQKDGSVVAKGERSVAIGGNVDKAVIQTGDNGRNRKKKKNR
jgi:hypothetical protein